jgi:hypothetical protein
VKRIVSLGFVVLLILLIAVPVSAGGPTDKATGDMDWVRNGSHRSAVFNAHEQMDNRPAKGQVTQYAYDSSGAVATYFVIDVDTVEVYDDWACFGGYAVDASPGYPYLGAYRVSIAIDGGEPGYGVDYFGGWFNADMDDCGAIKAAAMSQNWAVEGNVQIHLGKAHQ